MWPFLLILAIVPLIFFWSDSVEELFPSLKPYLPDKGKSTEIVAMQPQQTPAAYAGGEPGNWYVHVSETQTAYVAWVISQDGQYRLAVGCYLNTPATLQVTHLTGNQLPEGLRLNYQYGQLPLTSAAYVGPDLINATAQFKEVHLQGRGRDVIAQFQMPGAQSNAVARQLSDSCPSQAAQ